MCTRDKKIKKISDSGYISMGKCVSKEPTTGFREFSSNSYIAIYDDNLSENEGQSESKKAAKKAGLETKGTAMSFGFKKKNSAKQSGTSANNNSHNINNNNNIKEKEKHNQSGKNNDKYKSATVISNIGVVHVDDDEIFISDKNGNTGSLESLEESDVATNGRCTTPRLQPPKKETSGTPYRNNRFGFRQANAIRPASVGLQPKINDFDNIINNNMNNNTNNYKLTNNLNTNNKRRSKSASATSRLTTLLSSNGSSAHQQHQQQLEFEHHKYQNPKINAFNPEYVRSNNQTSNASMNSHLHYQHHQQQKQYSNLTQQQQQPQYQHYTTVIDSELHTNKIVKPIPQTVSISKFTLHTASLPRPQYPVPISLTSGATSSSSRCSVMDTKVAKHAVNTSRKENILREESCDSGISSFDSYNYAGNDPSRMPRQRYRNLEMIMSGRNKFELRDLETLSDDSITSLVLPKLPSDINSASVVPLSGLIRTTATTTTSDRLPSTNTGTTITRRISDGIDEIDSNLISNNKHNNNGLCPLARKESITSSEMESFEEEKLIIDNNSSEKSMKGAITKDVSEKSKTSSPGSSRSSWCNAGEAMAFKDYSSNSMSSSDEYNSNLKQIKKRDEEDTSSVTITAGHQSLLLSSSISSKIQSKHSENTVRPPSHQHSNKNNNNRDNFMMNFEESKFAEIAAAVSDALLDDETSPTDSLVSSYSEDAMGSKKNKKKLETRERDFKEKDIDEISPELDTMSPVSPGTPTHASNSLSLSDGGRDFLIDDEIADQPELVFDNENDNMNCHDSSIMDIQNSSLNFNGNSSTDTPTLRDASSLRSASKKTPINKPRKVMASQYESPAMPRKKRSELTRTESLDTLSPCESIGSDDFMLDFDSNSSLDSIDRIHKSNGSGNGSGILMMDETQLWSELENKGGDIMREWSSLLRTQTQQQASRENINSITSQLPARATRLLTRRLQSNAGSDSPRSLDSVSGRTPVLKGSFNQYNRCDSNTNSADDLSLIDKSIRNAMLHDVAHCKKQLICLRRILQEDEDNLLRTETLNPFETNGSIFGNCGMGGGIEDKSQQDPKAVAVLAMLEDQRQELTDLRRQVVYLQTQLDDKDRLIRIQQNIINKLEAEKETPTEIAPPANSVTETMNTATQTDRLRPLSIGGQDGISSKVDKSPAKNGLKSNIPDVTSKIIKQPLNTNTNSNIINNTNVNNKKSSTQISSVYTQLSSVKQIPIANNKLGSKTVKTTRIGNVDSSTLNKFKITNQNQTLANGMLSVNPIKSIPNPVTVNGDSKIRTSIRTQINGNHNYNSSTTSKLSPIKKTQLKSVSSTSSLSSSGTGIASKNSSTTSLNNNNNNNNHFIENNNNNSLTDSISIKCKDQNHNNLNDFTKLNNNLNLNSKLMKNISNGVN